MRHAWIGLVVTAALIAGCPPPPNHGPGGAGTGTGSGEPALVGNRFDQPPPGAILHDGDVLTPSPCDLPIRPIIDACNIGSWGSNAAVLNEFPIDGLNFDGCRNRDGVRVVPDSFHAASGACANGATLAVSHGALVGLDANGAIACGDDALAGATFELEGPLFADDGTPRGRWTLPVTIGAAGRVASLPEGGGAAAPIATYSLDGPAGPLCPVERAFVAPFPPEAVTAPPPGTPAPPSLPSRQAVLVAGELYHLDATTVELAAPAPWVNVACAGGALAKSRLLGYDPALTSADARATTPEERVATLKMIMSYFCPALASESRTVQGTPLEWIRPGQAAPAGVGPIEAIWGKDGALCISHARLWRSDPRSVQQLPAAIFLGLGPARDWRTTDERDFVQAIRDRCGIPDCADLPAPAAAAASWTTYTIDHQPHP